jgi:hypothetical protein
VVRTQTPSKNANDDDDDDGAAARATIMTSELPAFPSTLLNSCCFDIVPVFDCGLLFQVD